jgi:PEGA domain
MARAKRLRERGQLREAIELLELLPPASVSGSPLDALLSEMRAELVRRQATESALAEAAAAADRDSFQGAIDSLQAVQRAWGESPEIAVAIGEIESKRSQLAGVAVSKAVDKARAALLAKDAAAALAHLREAGEWVEFASINQQADWRRLETEATRPAARKSTGDIPQVSSGPAEAAAAPRKPKLLISLILAGAVAVIAVSILVMHFVAKPAVRTQAPVQQVPSTPVAPLPGTLAIDGNVEGVQVFVDGLLQGFTQKDGKLNLPLDPGTHTIRLSMAGYSDVAPSTVTIVGHQSTALHYDLNPLASAAPPSTATEGFLSVHSSPGAKVSLDHVPAGTTDARGNLILPVKPGARFLQIALSGFQPASRKVNIRAGEHDNLSVLLTPIAGTKAGAPAPQPVQILAFSATASQIEQGQSTTLQWNTANASEVSINNGIARVDSSGQTTVRPQSTTSYVLTAIGNGGTQQRSINIIVQPKPAVAAAPIPAAPRTQDDSPLVGAVLEKFGAALASHNVKAMKAVWPSMTSSQEKLFRDFFKHNRDARISDACDPSLLTFSGNSAAWTCSETTTIMVGGSPVNSDHVIRFAFTKSGGDWIVADRR